MSSTNRISPLRGNTGFSYGYVIVAAAFLIMVLIYGVRFSFGVFVKPMAQEFGWSRAMVAGAFSLSWIVEGILALGVGRLNDRFGPRLTISILGFLAGLSYLLMGRLTSPWQLYLFLGVIGGAGNGVFVPLTSTIARWFTRKRSLMTGIAISGIGIGSVISPLLANKLIAVQSWRASYTVLGVAVLGIVIVAAQFLRRHAPEAGPAKLPQKGAPEAQRMSLEYSLREAIASRRFWLFFGMMFCLGFAFFSLQVHLAPHATDIRLQPATAAAILATVGAASIAGRGILGGIGDKIGNKRAFMLGFGLIALSLVWLVMSAAVWKIYVFAAFFGLAYGNSATQQSPLAASLFGLRNHGVIFGAAGIGFTIGSALGPFLTGHFFDSYGTYRIAFLVAAAVAFTGLALNSVIPSRHPQLVISKGQD